MLTAKALVAAVDFPHHFCSGRCLATYLGLTIRAVRFKLSTGLCRESGRSHGGGERRQRVALRHELVAKGGET